MKIERYRERDYGWIRTVARRHRQHLKREVMITPNLFWAWSHGFGYSSVALTSASIPDLH